MAIPGSLGSGPRITMQWAADLTQRDIAADIAGSGAESPDRTQISLWRTPDMFSLNPADGSIVSHRRYEQGAAFSSGFSAAAPIAVGEVQVYDSAGHPAFVLDGYGRFFFRDEHPFIISSYLDYLKAFTLDGEPRWEVELQDIITAVEVLHGVAFLGTAGGSVHLVDDAGVIRTVRQQDDNPILGIGFRADEIWIAVGGSIMALEKRMLPDPAKIVDTVVLTYPAESPLELRMHGDTLFLPRDRILIRENGAAESLPDGYDFYSMLNFPAHLQITSGVEASQPLRTMELRNQWGGLFWLGLLPVSADIMPREDGLLIWNGEWAVLYHFGEQI
ncbi:MAG: hypothetical protein ACOCVC_09190 [Spirochaeta sp.]